MIKITDKPKQVIILGAGGTGSWLIQFLSKLDFNNTPIVIDGDIIEAKNTLRQNFVNDDIGKFKSQVMNEHYGFDYITEYVNSVEMLSEIIDEFPDTVPVIVGCLDNNGSRKLVHETMELYDDFIWVDSGNAERHGQTYIAIKESGEIKFPSPLGFDEALSKLGKDERRPDEISCAEQTESAPQNVTANVTAATILFNTLNIILNNGFLLGNKIEFDTKTITFSNKIITE